LEPSLFRNHSTLWASLRQSSTAACPERFVSYFVLVDPSVSLSLSLSLSLSVSLSFPLSSQGKDDVLGGSRSVLYNALVEERTLGLVGYGILSAAQIVPGFATFVASKWLIWLLFGASRQREKQLRKRRAVRLLPLPPPLFCSAVSHRSSPLLRRLSTQSGRKNLTIDTASCCPTPPPLPSCLSLI
jgi:hypothetical protein